MEIQKIIIFLLIPIISAFIGWFTNYLAIKSLFRPINKMNFFFFSFQGLIPKRKKIISKKLAEVVEEYFLSHNDFQRIFKDKESQKKIKTKILPILEAKLIEKIPPLMKIVAEPLVKKILAEEIDGLIERFAMEISDHIEENFDIKKIVYEKIESYDVSKLEIIIKDIAEKEFKHIERLGALIGFIVGLFQVVLFLIL